MFPMTINHMQPAFSCGHIQPALALAAPRELSDEEMDMVSGGLPIVIAPIIVKGVGIAVAAFITGFAGHSGYIAASHVWGEEEQACR